MNINFFRRLSVIALVISAAMSFTTLQAQNTPSVLEQLQAQYTLARGTDGCHVGNPDSALEVQSPGGGMRVLPVSSSTVTIAKCTNSYADGKLKPANSTCNGEGIAKAGGWLSKIPKVGATMGQGASKIGDQAANQLMDVVRTGEMVYPIKLEVNESKGEVKFSLITCKQSNDQQNPYKGDIVFHFKGLKPENVSQVEEAISKVFKQGGDDPGNNGNGGQDQDNQSEQDAQKGSNQGPACNPEVGQTLDQIVSTCGQPANQSKGANGKLLYFYNQPKIKIIFVSGKVADTE